MIRTDGYYISEGYHWIDWHAGHKFEGVTYDLFKFKDNNIVITPTSNTNIFDINIFKEREKIYIDEYFLLNKNTLEIIFNPKSKWAVKRQYTILSPEILLDENMREFRFIPL